MLIKLSMTYEMLPEVQDDGTAKDAPTIWKHLKDLHEVLDKGRAFFLKNIYCFMLR